MLGILVGTHKCRTTQTRNKSRNKGNKSKNKINKEDSTTVEEFSDKQPFFMEETVIIPL